MVDSANSSGCTEKLGTVSNTRLDNMKHRFTDKLTDSVFATVLEYLALVERVVRRGSLRLVGGIHCELLGLTGGVLLRVRLELIESLCTSPALYNISGSMTSDKTERVTSPRLPANFSPSVHLVPTRLPTDGARCIIAGLNSCLALRLASLPETLPGRQTLALRRSIRLSTLGTWSPHPLVVRKPAT